MPLILTLPAVTIGNREIPEHTFTEGVDFNIRSPLQEGETSAYREEMVAELSFGHGSERFRDYAQKIGVQRGILSISEDAAGFPSGYTGGAMPSIGRQPSAETPTGFSLSAATATGNRATASWSPVAGAQSYDIFVTPSRAKPTLATPPTRGGITQTNATVGGLDYGTTYFGYIRAVGTLERDDNTSVPFVSEWSDVQTATTPAAPGGAGALPSVPTNFRSTGHDLASVSFAWSRVAGSNVRYDLYIVAEPAAGQPPLAPPTSSTVPTALCGGATSYTIGNLAAGNYRAYVRARTLNGPSAWSVGIRVGPAVAPEDAPLSEAIRTSGFRSTEQTATTVTLEWDAVAGVETYELYYTSGRAAPGIATRATISRLVDLRHIVTRLTPATRYRFFLRGRNAAGASVWSLPVLAATQGRMTSPGVATTFRAKAFDRTSFTVDWPAVAGAESYEIYYTQSFVRPRNGDNIDFTPQGVGLTTLEYTATGLNAGEHYNVYLRSRNNIGVSRWSDPVRLTLTPPRQVDIIPPPVPRNLRVVTDGTRRPTSTSLTLDWTTGTGPGRVASYEVYYNTSGTAPTPSTRHRFSVTRRGITVPDLDANTTYHFWVRARAEQPADAPLASAWSATSASGTTLNLPAVPANLRASVIYRDALQIAWDPAARAVSYDMLIDTIIVATPTSRTQPTVREVDATQYIIEDIWPGSGKQVYVRSVSAEGNRSAWTRILRARTNPTGNRLDAPPTPQNLRTYRVAGGFIGLVWDSAAKAAGYEIFRSTGAVAPDDDTEGNRLLGYDHVTNYENLPGGTGYRFYIRAKNTAGFSPWSDALLAATPRTRPTLPPPIPTALTSGATTRNSIAFSWGPAARAESYDIYVTTAVTPPRAGTSPTATGLMTTSYTATGLSGQTTYRAYVRAVNVSGAGDWSDAVTATTSAIPAPAVPALSVTSRTTSAISYSWGDITDATSYQIYISTTNTAPSGSTVPTATISTGVAYTRTGLTQSTTYYAWLRAVGPGGTGDWSAVSAATTLGVPVPSNLRSTSRGFNNIAYAWNAVSGATSYEMYISTTSTEPTAQTTPTVTGLTATTYQRTGLTAGTTYYAWVRAVTAGGTSVWSAALTRATVGIPVPTNFRLTIRTEASLFFAWDAVAGATGYQVYFSSSATAPTAQTTPTATRTRLTYPARGLQALTTYYCWVRTMTASGVSAWSSVMTGTTRAVPVPSNFRSTGRTFNTITYGWGSVANATSYQIYFSTTNTAPTAETTPTATTSSRTYTRTGLSAGTTYYAWVRVVAAAGTSAWSSVVTQTTQAVPVPSNFRSTARTFNNISYGWSAVTAATGYDLYISTSSAAPTAQTVATASTSSTAYTRTGLSAGTTYYAWVRTVTAAGSSAWSSAVAQATRTITIPSPTVAFSTISQTGFTISWSGTSASSYEVYYSTSSTNPTAQTTPTATTTSPRYAVTGLPPGRRTYFYWVRAVYGTIRSSWSSRRTTQTFPEKLGRVTGVYRSFRSGNRWTFMWNAVSGATGYEIYRSTSSTAPSADRRGTRVTGTSGTVTITATRYVFVRAIQVGPTSTQGDWSAPFRASP